MLFPAWKSDFPSCVHSLSPAIPCRSDGKLVLFILDFFYPKTSLKTLFCFHPWTLCSYIRTIEFIGFIFSLCLLKMQFHWESVDPCQPLFVSCPLHVMHACPCSLWGVTFCFAIIIDSQKVEKLYREFPCAYLPAF